MTDPSACCPSAFRWYGVEIDTLPTQYAAHPCRSIDMHRVQEAVAVVETAVSADRDSYYIVALRMRRMDRQVAVIDERYLCRWTE